jgi:hypothetical protein
MSDYMMEQEIRRRLRLATIMLINLSEDSEQSISLDSIREVQENLEELSSLLESAKYHTLTHNRVSFLESSNPFYPTDQP